MSGYFTISCDVCGEEASDHNERSAAARWRAEGGRYNSRTREAVCDECINDAQVGPGPV